jgi:hypothetical protein
MCIIFLESPQALVVRPFAKCSMKVKMLEWLQRVT